MNITSTDKSINDDGQSKVEPVVDSNEVKVVRPLP